MAAPIAQAIALSIILLVIHRIGLIIYRLYFHPLSKYPGPKYLAISGLPHTFYQNVRGTFYKQIRDLHNQHGNIVRVAPNELSIDGSIGWTDIFGHRKAGQEEFGKDTLFYRPQDQGKGLNGSGLQDIFTANRDDHRRQRKLISHAFSDSALMEQEDLVMKYVDSLMQRLKENSARGTASDLVKYFNFLTFDVIGDLAFGDSFGCLDSNETHPWVKMIYTVVKSQTQMRVFAEYPFLTPFRRFVVSEVDEDSVKKNMAFTEKKVEKRIAQGKNLPRKDFLSYILRHNDEKGLNHEELLAISRTFIIAGSETTATLLSGLSYYLSRHPTEWHRLTTEVRDAFSSEPDITMRGTAALPYLHACLEEGLRIFPPVALTPSRFSPGAEVNGEYIPEGTKIWIHQWSTYHRESNFHLADEFHPERWLPPTHPYYENRFASDNRACMQAFSTGPRNCVGKNLAYAEMRLVMARLAWNFEMETTPESLAWLEGQKVYTVFQKSPLPMKLHLREEGKVID